MTTTKNKKNKKRNFIIILIVVVLIASIIFCIGLLNNKKSTTIINNRHQEEFDYREIIWNNKEMRYNTSIVSILFMGIDTKESEKLGQADVMQLVLLDRENETIKVIPFSRDIMTEIRMFDVSRNDLGWNEQHLGLAYAYGDTRATGCILTTQAISRLLGNIPINYYAAIDLTMLDKIQAVVGDLEVTIPNDSLESINSEWQEGKTITITIDNVEAYLRTRSINEDFSNNKRMERQKVYLDEYFNKLKNMLENNVENTVKILYNLSGDMTTNINLTDIQNFAGMMMSYDFDSDNNYYALKGENKLGAIHDEFYLDENYLKELILKLFYRMEE